MPNRLYAAADQLANLSSAPDPGVDIVPGNVLKVAFVALAGAAFTSATIKTSAAWQTAVTADDLAPNLIVVTPFIDSFEIAPTTPLTEGGNDTSTANGVPRLRSTSFAPGKGMISGCSAAQIKALRKLAAKSGNFQHGTRLGMFLLHEGNGISCLNEKDPIPVYNVFFGDAKKGGLGASNDYNMEFHLEGGWSLNESVIETDFVVSTLVNPTAE